MSEGGPERGHAAVRIICVVAGDGARLAKRIAQRAVSKSLLLFIRGNRESQDSNGRWAGPQTTPGRRIEA